MKNRFAHNRFADFSLNYHMVQSTAFNRKVIVDDVVEVVLQTIRSKSEELGVTIHEIEVVDQCYVECYFSAPLKICLADYLKAVKPTSTKQAFKAYPELRWLFNNRYSIFSFLSFSLPKNCSHYLTFLLYAGVIMVVWMIGNVFLILNI